MQFTQLPATGACTVLDTETTGLDAQKDRIIEFGAVVIENNQIVARHHWYFNPGEVEIDPEALRVHGITPEFLADKPSIKKHLPEILGIVYQAIIGGHNVGFDIKFLDAECRRNNFPTVSEYMAGIIDTMMMSKERYPGKAASLDALLDRLGISRAQRDKHGALLDAELTAQALLAMSKTQLSMFAGETQLEEIRDAQTGEPMPEILVIKASESELSEHEAYLTALEKQNKQPPLWRLLDAERLAAKALPQTAQTEQGEPGEADDSEVSAPAMA